MIYIQIYTDHHPGVDVVGELDVSILGLGGEGVFLQPLQKRQVQPEAIVGKLRGVDVCVYQPGHHELSD